MNIINLYYFREIKFLNNLFREIKIIKINFLGSKKTKRLEMVGNTFNLIGNSFDNDNVFNLHDIFDVHTHYGKVSN